MLKIWGKLMKNNKIMKDIVVSTNLEGSYQDNLKQCIIDLCRELDIEKPYWLPSNLEEFNARGKVIFDHNNFIEDINFDRLILQELESKEL